MAELVEKVCPICGIIYGLEHSFYEYRRSGSANEREKGWHCPNGHSLIVTKTVADELREQLEAERRLKERAQQNIAYWQDNAKEAREQAKRERNRANGYKGHATRITKRVKAGVCPCCNRHFVQLERHMANKHPDFTPLEINEGEPA